MYNFNSANWLLHLKRVAAVCLFSALFLPLTQCSPATKPEQSQQTSVQKQVKSALDTRVFASSADSDSIALTTVNIFIFIWPLLLSLLTWIRPQLDEHFSLRHIEVLLSLCSFIFLYRLTAFGEPLFGAYLAWSALSAYSLITILRLLSRTHEKWYR